MLENIWRYSVDEGECGGIVIAANKEEALQKVTEMYNDYVGEGTDVLVWQAIKDDDYSKDYQSVLEIYG